MIGQTISHYKILEKLGEGGMGVVYKAHDTMLDRDVALKFLPHYLTSDPTEKERFYHEARASAALTHANIAVVHEIGEYGGQIFIAMEYVEGKTLKEIITEESPSIKKILDIAIQVCEGLAAAHEKGIVHRDIKSDNIMVTQKGQAKITDFGLAKLKGATKLTKAGSTLGTAAYMSPEQAQGEDVDQRSDIFSFGVVLYELLTAKLPFRGEHHSALMYSIINEEPQPIARFNEKVTPEIEHIVSKALEKDRDDRYQHVDELLSDLRRERKKLEYARAGYASVTVPPGSIHEIAFRGKNKLLRYGMPTAAVVLAVLLLVIFNPFNFQISTQKSTASGPNSIAVMYFENLTDEANLNKILVEMLTTNLGRCQDLKVIGSQRLFDILKQLGKENRESVDKGTATEVAKIAGVKTMLLGSIIKIGNKIRITSNISDVQTGEIIASDQVEGEKVEAVFDLVDRLTQQIVARLVGAKENFSIRDVTTKSYQAYKLYQLALEKSYRFDMSGAATTFREVIQIDSTFAMAYLHLISSSGVATGFNMIYADPDLIDWFENAKKYSVNCSGREKALIDMGVMALYGYGGNWPSAEQIGRKFIATYGADKLVYENTGWVCASQGKLQEAVDCGERMMELDPTFANGYNDLAYFYSYAGEHEKALSAIKKYMALQPEELNPYDSGYDMFMNAQRPEDARRILEDAMSRNADWWEFNAQLGYIDLLQGNGDMARNRFHRVEAKNPPYMTRAAGLVSVYEGQYNRTEDEFRRAIALDDSAHYLRSRLRDIIDLGKIYNANGEFKKSIEQYDRALDLSTKIFTKGWNPIQFFRLFHIARACIASHQFKEAEDNLQQIRALNGFSLMENLYYLANAELEHARGNITSCQSSLDKMDFLTRRYNPIAIALQIDIDFQNKKYSEITQSLKEKYYSSFSQRTVAGGDDLFYSLVRPRYDYWIGKAYDQLGNIQEAAEYYKRFLHTWENADREMPEIVDAKMRLKTLEHR